LKATSAADVGLLLAGSMCLLPFLIPYHQQPVLSFYPEWLAVALGIAAAATVLASRGFAPPAALPAPALWIAGFSVFLVLRAAFGEQAYPQSAVLAALYALYAALMVQLGAQLVAAQGVARVATVLAGFVLAGALANAAAGVVQFYGRPMLFEDVIAELHGRRAYGNIAQSNLYTNYLALGQAALVLLWLRQRLRTAYALAALGLLAVASALSGARAALLYVLWFAAFGAWTAYMLGGLDGRRLRRAVYVVAAAIAVAQIVVPWVNGALQLGLAGESAFDRIRALPEERFEPRLPIFLLALRIFAAAPIAGTGIGEFAGAAYDLGLGPALTAIGDVWTSPHDLPLQLLAETGLVGAVLALGALCVWGIALLRRYRHDASPELWWIAAAAGVELIHSMIEYPLWSANFLGLSRPDRPADRCERNARSAIARRHAGSAHCGRCRLRTAVHRVGRHVPGLHAPRHDACDGDRGDACAGRTGATRRTDDASAYARAARSRRRAMDLSGRDPRPARSRRQARNGRARCAPLAREFGRGSPRGLSRARWQDRGSARAARESAALVPPPARRDLADSDAGRRTKPGADCAAARHGFRRRRRPALGIMRWRAVFRHRGGREPVRVAAVRFFKNDRKEASC